MNAILWSGLLIIIISLVLLGNKYSIYKKRQNNIRKQLKNALRNKVVVITGASSGIGEAVAHAFYDEGCQVVLAARRLHELMRVKKDLMNKKLQIQSPEPIILKLDLSDFDECEVFAKKVEIACGHVDILINNGGLSHRGPNFDTTLEIHRRIMDVNYLGTIAITNAILHKMIERKSGHIAIVGSVLCRMTLPYRGPYCASKHALMAFADSLRAEVHEHNVRVSLIAPGYVKTDISAKALNGATGEETGKLDDEAENGFPPELVARRLLAMVLNGEDEAFICQPLVYFALFLRHALPSVYFSFMNKRRE